MKSSTESGVFQLLIYFRVFPWLPTAQRMLAGTCESEAWLLAAALGRGAWPLRVLVWGPVGSE